MDITQEISGFAKIVKLGGFEVVLESSNQLMDHQLIRLLLPASSPIFTVKVSIRFLHDVYTMNV